MARKCPHRERAHAAEAAARAANMRALEAERLLAEARAEAERREAHHERLLAEARAEAERHKEIAAIVKAAVVHQMARCAALSSEIGRLKDMFMTAATW
jgi:hypothetical protein